MAQSAQKKQKYKIHFSISRTCYNSLVQQFMKFNMMKGRLTAVQPAYPTFGRRQPFNAQQLWPHCGTGLAILSLLTFFRKSFRATIIQQQKKI